MQAGLGGAALLSQSCASVSPVQGELGCVPTLSPALLSRGAPGGLKFGVGLCGWGAGAALPLGGAVPGNPLPFPMALLAPGCGGAVRGTQVAPDTDGTGHKWHQGPTEPGHGGSPLAVCWGGADGDVRIQV